MEGALAAKARHGATQQHRRAMGKRGERAVDYEDGEDRGKSSLFHNFGLRGGEEDDEGEEGKGVGMDGQDEEVEEARGMPPWRLPPSPEEVYDPKI